MIDRKIFFLGSDRLPHCNVGVCADEYYYSGETVRFVVDVGPFVNWNNGFVDGWCVGSYYAPESPYFTEGMHPPIVYGKPRFVFKLTNSAGVQNRYATLNTNLSDVPQGYLVYDYVIQGTDGGATIDMDNSIVIATDPENRISLYVSCYYNDGLGNSGVYSYDEDFSQNRLLYPSYPNVSNVRFNYDSAPR
jgi:hypothetical protein